MRKQGSSKMEWGTVVVWSSDTENVDIALNLNVVGGCYLSLEACWWLVWKRSWAELQILRLSTDGAGLRKSLVGL